MTVSVWRVGVRSSRGASNSTPEQVLFLVDGTIRVEHHSHLRGTVFGRNEVRAGIASVTDGALLGSDRIRLLSAATVNLHPFAGW
jgi:hypothetical protein